MTDPQPVDWRGTPITPGALVIYGAGVGRSIAMVEATVADPMLTPSGRIWLDVIRRAYGDHGNTDVGRVHVGADRLTVVTQLPPTDMPTADDKAAAQRAKNAVWEAERVAARQVCAREGHVWREKRQWQDDRSCTRCFEWEGE